MSNFIEDTKRRVLIGELSILLYSVFATLLGRTAKTFIIVFVLIIVISLLQNRRGTNPLGQAKVKPESVLSGRKLYSEENVREIQTKDTEMLRDIQEQSKFTMYTSLGMVVAMAYFFVLWPHIDALYSFFASHLGEGKLAEFVSFLTFFEGLFVINQIVYLWALRKVGTVTMVQMPQSYTVTDKGIVIKGLASQTALTFPLPDDVEVVVNEKRRFVELVKRGKRTVTKIRFYARNPKRLAEVIKRYARSG